MDTNEQAKAAKAGNSEAFLRLLEGSKERLYRIALAYLHQEADALDAVQEATCRAFQSLRKLKEPSHFETWMVRIVLNACADEYKKRRRRGPEAWLEKTGTAGIAGAAIAFSDASDTRVSLRQLVDGLPREQKEIIILKYYQQLTVTEVAAVLECPEGTVKTRLHKALVTLRGVLGEEGIHDFARA
nr:sigma-70 family RNA polymerase sigma factor [Paenibacillus sacheonensis]